MTNGYDVDRGAGWVLFAGIMIVLVGALMVFVLHVPVLGGYVLGAAWLSARR